MTNYQKRNEREEADMQPDAELLVRGEFKDDEDDEGYTTTRWLGLTELATADKAELEEAIDEFETLLAGAPGPAFGRGSVSARGRRTGVA